MLRGRQPILMVLVEGLIFTLRNTNILESEINIIPNPVTMVILLVLTDWLMMLLGITVAMVM